MTRFPDRVFAFDQFGPLSIRPCHGACWARKKHPDRLPATYHRYHGTRYFHGCYDLANDRLWGVLHEHKGGRHTLLKSIRAARPDGAPIYIVLDNLSCNTTPAIRTWAAAHKVELCLTPTNASWADPIEAQFGPLRMFTMANSDYPNHIVLARDLHAYLRWRNANARHPEPRRAGRPTPRTRPRPQRTPPPLGPTSTRGLTKQVIIRGQRTSGPAGGVDLLRGRGRPDPAPTPGHDLGAARAHPGRAGVGQGLGPDLDRRAAGLPPRAPRTLLLPAGRAPRASRGTPQPVRGRLRRPAVRRAPAVARPDHPDLGQLEHPPQRRPPPHLLTAGARISPDTRRCRRHLGEAGPEEGDQGHPGGAGRVLPLLLPAERGQVQLRLVSPRTFLAPTRATLAPNSNPVP
jgi:hypothetical protein